MSVFTGKADFPPGVYADPDRLVALQHRAHGFSFLPRQPVYSLLSGRHASRLRGRGLNFEEMRRYQSGDDIRQIDWKVTLRTGKTHSRVYTEERERVVMLIVDQRRSMFFGSVRNMKSVSAAELAALAAWRVIAQKDRVGALIFNDTGCVEIKPQRSRANVMRILGEIVTQNHELTHQEFQPVNDAAFDAALHRCERLVKHDSLVCIFSDARGFGDESRRILTRIAGHNDVLFGFIHDPLEVELPKVGQLYFSDGQRHMAVDTNSQRLRQQFHDDFAKERAEGRLFLLHREAPVLPISAAEDVVEQLQRLLGNRAR